MPKAPLKKRQISKAANARKAKSSRPMVRKKKPKRISHPRAKWVAVGIDLSMSSISGAAFAYDDVLRREIGPVYAFQRWSRQDHDYIYRLKQCAKGHEIILDLIAGLKLITEPDDVYIAIEEPWPYGMQKKLESQSLKQQAQLSGAFIGGLFRWGYEYVYEIHNQWWKEVIATDLGITTHWSKYGKGIEGKMRAKEWALKFHDAPDWPDLISNNKHGLIPRPSESKAKAQQPDDRYDALAMAVWMRNQILKGESDATE